MRLLTSLNNINSCLEDDYIESNNPNWFQVTNPPPTLAGT